MSSPPDHDDLDAVTETVQSRPRSVAVSDVVALLETTDQTNRATVTHLLGTIVEQDPSRACEVVRCLVPLLDRPDADLRGEAATAIRHVAAESPHSLDSAVDPLIDGLDDDAPLVRLNATAALSEAAETYPTAIGDAAPQLSELLDSDLPVLRVHATSIVRTLAAEVPEAVSPASSALLDTVASRSPAGTENVPAGNGGTQPDDGGIQPEEVEQRLRRFEADTREVRTTARRNAAAALVRIAEDGPDPLDADASRIIDVIEGESDATVALSLLTLLGFVAEDHPTEVLPATEFLTDCLRTATDDAIVGKAAWVCSLLADAAPERVGDELEPALPAIIDALEATPQARVPAVSLLAYMGEQYPERVEPARPVLRDLLESDYPSARTGAALTLGFVGNDATLSVLRTVRDDDPEQNVRRAAEESIQLIRQRRAG